MVSSIVRSIPRPAPRPTVPDYHHYVRSLLHRRWLRVCTLVLVMCYVEAWLVTNKRSIFWSLLSASPAKAALMWTSLLPVLIMRVQLVHLGAKVRSSAAQDIQHLLGSFNTYASALSYIFSAWVFTLLYMMTSNDTDQLGITIEQRHNDRSRLNERFLYLTFLAVWTGIIHTVAHLSSDRDRIDLPSVTVEPKKHGEELALEELRKTNAFKEKLMKEGCLVLLRALRQSIIATTTGMFAYLPVRGPMWRYTLRITRIFYRLSTSSEPYSWPVGFLFFFRTLWVSFLVFLLWEFTQSTFIIYFSMEPLKDGQVLSSLSADANGTLLTGFRHTGKPLTQAYAFWELVYICFNLPGRRKTLLLDIEPVRTVDEIIKECLTVIDQANSSIQQKDKPPPPPSQSIALTLSELASPQGRPPMQSIRNAGDIFRSPDSSKKIPDGIKHWQSVDGSVLGDKVSAKLAPHTPDIKAYKEKAQNELNSVRKKFIESKAGTPFRQTVERRTQGLIPNVRLQIDAVAALSKLAVCAISEDEFGFVSNSIPRILERLFDAIDTLQGYIESPPIHWTDTESEGSEERVKEQLKEPRELLDVLGVATRDIVNAYQQYLGDLNLSVKVGKRVRHVLGKDGIGAV